jgi:predicted dehydrogenase
MIQAAIVGAGGIGKRHAGCYRQNPDAELAAVCDMDQEAAERAASELGCSAFSSVEALLRDGPRLDTVSVCTSGEENGGAHHAPTMQLLEAGVAVLGEKPISNRIDEGREMVAKAQAKNIAYGINLNHRFTPAARWARGWLDAGELGELNMLEMRMWINNKNESSPYFHMRALHPHSIDVMRYFAGPVKQVQAFFKKGAGRATWSNAQVNIGFENGVIGHLLGSYDGGGPGSPWGLERCEAIGQDARFVLEDACERLDFQPRGGLESTLYRHPGGMKSFGDTFQSRIDQWVADLVNQTPPARVDGRAEDALAAQEIIEAAIASWEEGRVVDLAGRG